MKKIILANWKMQLGYKDSIDLALNLSDKIEDIDTRNLEIGICPEYLSIPEISKKIKSDKLKLGVQNIFWENFGAFTGEVSILNLKTFDVKYAIIGHSERRKYLGEDGEMINKKIKLAVKNNFIPVLCVGENFDERRNDKKDIVILQQIKAALSGVDFASFDKFVIAYEPVWVIGSGQAIDPEEAEHTNLVIKEAVFEAFSTNKNSITRDVLEVKCKFIYGGSVDKNNVASFLNKKSIDGVLVGGASLKLDSFLDLINISNKL